MSDQLCIARILTFRDLLVDIFKLELEFLLLLVSLPHHLVEVFFDLDHLVVQATKLLILLLCCFVHVCFW